MNCTSCGAKMAADAIVCDYCGLHNAVDLLAIRDFKVLAEHAELDCPEGCGELRLLQLDAELNVTVAHCPSCNGLKFAPGALQIIVGRYASRIRELNIARISRVVDSRLPRSKNKSLPCPVCLKEMKRGFFDPELMVEIDECAEHGIWLEPGELSVIADLWVRLKQQDQRSSDVEFEEMLEQKERKYVPLKKKLAKSLKETPAKSSYGIYVWIICTVAFLYQCSEIMKR